MYKHHELLVDAVQKMEEAIRYRTKGKDRELMLEKDNVRKKDEELEEVSRKLKLERKKSAQLMEMVTKLRATHNAQCLVHGPHSIRSSKNLMSGEVPIPNPRPHV